MNIKLEKRHVFLISALLIFSVGLFYVYAGNPSLAGHPRDEIDWTSSSCSTNNYLYGFSSTGSPLCREDISGSESSIGIPQSCSYGYLLSGFGSSGLLECSESPFGNGDITAVYTWDGLIGAAISGETTLNLNTNYISSCTGTNKKIIYDYSYGSLTCADDQIATSGGDISSVSAGTGLSGGGTSGDVSLQVDYSQVQTKIPSISCPNGQALTSFNGNSFVCGEFY